jgi:hypothetical protein
MKPIHSKNRPFILTLILVLGMGCVFSSAKTPRAPTPETPTLPATAVNTPVTLPSEIPTAEPELTSTTPAGISTNEAVPEEYKALYQELSSGLNQFEIKLSQQPKIKTNAKTATIAVELAFANGNAGEALLNPQVMEYNRLLLDRLQAMGVRGIVLGIKYPLLKKGFPHADDYLKFYKAITNLCHQHDMKVLVEAGPIFSGTPYSTVKVDWAKESASSYLRGLQDQLVLISKEIRPDYLTLANEPTTEEALTDIQISPTVWQNFLETTLKKVDRTNGTLYGAGTGTWENSEYMQAVFKVSDLDYIDLHIYPLNKEAVFLDRAVSYSTQANTAGKKVVISECWMYKAGANELSSNLLGSYEKVQIRDVFNYWTPLDIRYMKDIITLADSNQMEFVSFFWMRNYFYSMAENPTTQNLTTREYNQLINQGTIQAIKDDTLSELGKGFKKLLAERDAR